MNAQLWSHFYLQTGPLCIGCGRMSNWLALTDFSTKYSVSISTLRRRIKDKSIEFKLEDGKYFILDEQLAKNTSGRKPIQIEAQSVRNTNPEFNMEVVKNNNLAQALIDEIKRAYTQVLHEKEAHIFQLREEIADLKTLVKVLEHEVNRLTNSSPTEENQLDL